MSYCNFHPFVKNRPIDRWNIMSQPKKVLHIITVSFVINHFFGKQFKYLSEKSGNAYFLACSDSAEFEKWKDELDYTPFPVEITRSISPLKDLKAIYQLYRYIRKEKFDYVIAHTPKGGMVGMLSSFFAGVHNRVYFRHGIIYETSSGVKRMLLKNIDRLSGVLAKRVVCVSRGVQTITLRDHLNRADKNTILGKGTCNGVDALGRFNPDRYTEAERNDLKKAYNITADDFVLGYVGRLVHDKGIDELVAAWQLVRNQRKNVKLLLVGPFEERDSVSKVTQDIIAQDATIIHTGYVPDSGPFFSIMDTFVLPTYREGFPTVALEASSMKLPVIITQATGCEEAIEDGLTGKFITHDLDSIVKAILYYVDAPDIKKLHGNNGRAFILQYFEQSIVWDEISKKLGY